MNISDTGRLIAQTRENRGMSRHVLAKKLGVSADAVAAWENGKTFPDPLLLDRLAAVLGLRITKLLQGAVLPSSTEAVSLPGTERDLRDLIAFQRKEELRRKDFPGHALFVIGLVGLSAVLLHSRFHYGYITQIFGRLVTLRRLAWPLTSLPIGAVTIAFAAALFTGFRWIRRVNVLKNLPRP